MQPPEHQQGASRVSGAIQTLDHGFVRLVDSMGDDAAIVQAARVSYGAGTKTAREDAKLIDYLMRNKHTTPFEMVVLKYHLKMPLFLVAQLVRHRTASINSLSARYSEMPDEFYLPGASGIRAQGTANKQVADATLDAQAAQEAASIVAQVSADAYAAYTRLLVLGVGREQARMVLPQNLYTELYWQVNLHNLLHFAGLRDHPHAQAEMQVFARAIITLARQAAPIAVESWERHRQIPSLHNT